MATSPRLSFKGYNIAVALARNKDYIKSIVALFGTINVVTTDWKILGLTFAGMLVALVGKILIDATDYFFTEVDL